MAYKGLPDDVQKIYPFPVCGKDYLSVLDWLDDRKKDAVMFFRNECDSAYKDDGNGIFKYHIWDMFGANTKEDILEFWNLVYIETDRDRTQYLPMWGDGPPVYIPCVNLRHPYIHMIETTYGDYYLIQKIHVDYSVPLWKYTTSCKDLDNPNWVANRQKRWDVERFCSACEHIGCLEFCARCKHFHPGHEDMYKPVE